MAFFENRSKTRAVAGPIRPEGEPIPSESVEEPPQDFATEDDAGFMPPHPTRHESVPVFIVGAEPGNLPYIDWNAFTTTATANTSQIGELNRRRRTLRVRNIDAANSVILKRNPTDNDSMGYTLQPGDTVDIHATTAMWVSSALGAQITVLAEYDVEEYDE